MEKSVVVGVALTALLLLSAGCVKPEEESVTTEAAFDSEAVSLTVDGTASLHISVSPVELAADLVAVSADEDIVTISATSLDEDGVMLSLTAKTIGNTTITAVVDDVVISCEVVVNPIDAESVTLNFSTLELPVGGTATLVAEVLPANTSNPFIAWSLDKDSEEEKVVSVDNGVITALKPGETTVTATCGKVSAQCKVSVYKVNAESISFSITSNEITEGEAFLIDATVLPENITDKIVSWSSSDDAVLEVEPYDADETDNILSARVISRQPGTATVKAEIDGLSAECSVVVNAKVVPVVQAKIGDWFYSDGTWSDGGLVSINDDGTDPVWTEPRPAPEDGKTVIGIVFQTDTSRIYNGLKDNGYTHGLVIGVMGLYNFAQRTDPSYQRICSYTLDDSFGCIGGVRLTGYRWYSDLAGKKWTDTVCSYYAGKMEQCPVFDFATTDYPLAAPASTSGWYVPSSGELWDYLANLGGGEVAAYLKEYRDYGIEFEDEDNTEEQAVYDITYIKTKTFSYNVVDRLNSLWSQVPDSQRDDLIYCYLSRCQLFSSTIYQKGEACAMFSLSKTNSFGFEAGWLVGDPMVCHPVLAF